MLRSSTIAIRRAGSEDVSVLAGALARAFQDDPVFQWVVPDAANRQARLPAMFTVFSEAFLAHDDTYVAGQGAGAALWAPAGAEPVPTDRLEEFGDQMVAALADDADRGWEVQELLEEHHPEEPCSYLQFMGVVPEEQGRGIGSQLLETVLQRCDATGTPAYLEATSPDNRRLYERRGFEVVGEVTLSRGPSLWPMWRDPRVAQA